MYKHSENTKFFFIKTHFVQQTKHPLFQNISEHVNFEKKQGIVWELSMMRKSHKLTKRTTKTEKKTNPLKS